MSRSGYPTPDNFEGDADYICIPILVPNKTEFIAAIYGQYAEMTNVWYWKQTGTMTAETAALLSSYGLAQTNAYGECDVVDCEQVADCIETSEVVQTAIRNQTSIDNDQYGTSNPDYLSPSGTTSTTIINNRFPPSQRAEPIQEAPFECDNDILWAGIYYMVERIDEQGRDFLEGIITHIDTWERIIEFVGTVPIVGEVAENTLKAFVGAVPDIQNLYDAYSSTIHMEEIACALFQIVCNECRYPTFDEIMDYYAGFAMEDYADWVNLAVAASVDVLTASSGFASVVAYFSVNVFQLFVMYAQGTFLGARGSKTLRIWADIGEDNPDNGWELLCDGCEPSEWIIEYDFTVSDGGWIVSDASPDRGVWVSGEGWKSTTASGTTGMILQHTMPATCLVASGQMDFHFDGGSAQGRLRVNATGSGGTNIVQWGPTSTTPNSACGTPATPVNDTLLQFIADKSTGSQDIWVTSVKLRGTGEKPSGYTSDMGVTMTCP